MSFCGYFGERLNTPSRSLINDCQVAILLQTLGFIIFFYIIGENQGQFSCLKLLRDGGNIRYLCGGHSDRREKQNKININLNCSQEYSTTNKVFHQLTLLNIENLKFQEIHLELTQID